MNFNFIGEKRNVGFNSAILCLNEKFRSAIEKLDTEVKRCVQEIRIRVNKNLVLVCSNGIYFLSHDGKISSKETLLYAVPSDISEIIKIICSYSVYSHQNQLKNGFITLRGGHRAGICGTAVLNGTEIGNVRDVSSINIRIAREIKGCSEKILRKIGFNPKGTLIAGPPSSGKTTILRDLARNLSSMQIGEQDIRQSNVQKSNIKKVSVIDERGEIAAVYQGIPQVDIGMCDILNGYPKGIGILQAIRVLSPDIVICDEIGLVSEISVIEEGMKSGVEIIASVHSGDIKDFLRRRQVMNLLATGAFKNVVLLNDKSKYNGEFEFINVEDLYDKSRGNCDFDYVGDLNRRHGGT